MKKLQLVLIPAIVLIAGGVAFSFFFQDKHVSQGRHLFDRYCTPCHGNSGQGDGYNARNLDPHARDLTDKKEQYMVKLSNKEIYDVIDKGGRGVDLSGMMPAWGKVFSEEEIWSLVAYIRTLHPYKGEKVKFDKEKPYSTTRVRAPGVQENEFRTLMESKVPNDEKKQELTDQGKELFEEHGCIGCHMVGKKGGTLGPYLSRAGFMLQPQFIYRWIRNPQSFKPKTRMPNLGLSEDEALAVTLYLTTLKGPPLQPDGVTPYEDPPVAGARKS
ncbi:MAG: c-type cytochrome [Nitrospirae bacterium]|nr:c-type cytochrome [Candidatus Manganitrophaceae bacterium]